MRSSRGLALAVCLMAALSARAAAGLPRPACIASGVPLVKQSTPHYDITLAGTPLEALELGKLLEQAWPALADTLKAEPKLKDEKRLDFRVYANKEDWKKATLDDGQSMPSSAETAWFSPYTRVLYTFRQPGDVFTRMIVIYGAVLQFHGMCKEKNTELEAVWYVQGLAQALSVHFWDGEKLDLAVKPKLCAIDYPGRALAALGGEKFGLDPRDENRLTDPYVAWAAVRFALYGVDGKYRAKYQKLALGFTGSKVSGADFMRSLGREKDITREFHDWLLAEQTQLVAVAGGWEEKRDGRIVTDTELGVVSLACVREPATSLRVIVHGLTNRRTTKGVLLSCSDARNYTQARFEPPVVLIEWIRDLRTLDVQTLPLPHNGADAVVVTVTRLESKADPVKRRIGERPEASSLVIDNEPLGKFSVPEGRIGLVAQGAVEFNFLKIE